jgi:dienelactone hydrolase
MCRTLVLFVATLAMALAGAAPPLHADQDDKLVEQARDVVARLASGDVEPLMPALTDQMRAALDAARLKSLFPSVILQVGPFKGQTGTRTEARGEFRTVIVTCAFDRATLDVTVAFNAAGQIAGLNIRPPAAPAAAYAFPPYVKPGAFREETLVVDAGGWPLQAVLTVPAGVGPFPAVVLVHGSGPNDRDETLGPNKPFRNLAEGLASLGVAVLRYDKRTRTHGSRVSSLPEFTVKDEVIDDAAAAVARLLETPRVRADRVFVLGHSLGGMLAPRIADAAPAVAGLIILAGPTRSIEQAIVDQYRYIAMVDGAVSTEEQAQIDAAAKFADAVRALRPGDPPPSMPPFSAPTSYWLDLGGYNPAQAAARLSKPMLILQGARDYQVTMEDLEGWRAALGTRKDVEVRTYPTLNHLFIAGSGPSVPAEYTVPGHVDEAVVRDIAAWIGNRSGV